MRLLLKLLLILGILIVGIYAATPLWLPVIVAGLLPTGWQLDELDAGYWGFSGIDINSIRVNGELQAAGIEVIASAIRFSYQGLKTDIGSLSLEAHLRAIDDRNVDALTLDDLSLPVTVLTGEMPELSIRKLRVALYHELDQAVNNPLVLNFPSLKLTPEVDNSYHFVTDVSLEGRPGVNGRVDVDVNENAVKADIRFPASVSYPSWLDVAFEQTVKTLDSTTQIRAAFDTAAVDQEWLDSVLIESTGGSLDHVSGKLVVTADFAGKELQAIEQLSLIAEQLQLEFEGGSLNIGAAVAASRENEKVSITLTEVADIRIQDKSGQIHELIMNVMPGLQLTSEPLAMALAEVDAGSSFVIRTGKSPSMKFSGDIKLGITSAQSRGSFTASDLQIEIEDFSGPDKMSANGLIVFDWIEDAPFTYISDDIGLKADRLAFTGTGHMRLAGQNVDFNIDGPVTATQPVISLPGDDSTPPMTVAADEMSISASLISCNGALTSAGGGTFINGHIAPEATSAAKVDITWQELDLLNMAGKFGTKTQGFATELDGETWTGFDFDVTYTLLSTSDVKGSGTVMLDSGLEMPIVFAGNTQAEHWDVSLPPSTIKLSQLASLLRVAHFDLPETVKLTDGFIDMRGDVEIGDEITAEMTISGYEMSGSMQESSASEASFAFSAFYGNTISAKGPVSIKTVSLAGGIEVSHIQAGLNLESEDTFGLKNLYAEVFEGQVNLGSLRFSENRIEDTTLEMTHISLGRSLAFADIDGLDGTGFLNISLPAGSDESGIYIKDGIFSSTGPGHLTYTKEGIAGSNIGLQALENFQYKDLSGTVDYQSDGTYQIGVRLEGKNPDLYEGHPIVFNLNISGSLPELFSALFMTGSFEESILNQIRSK